MRIIIVGGPRCGKSTLARSYRARGVPTFCGDPASTVKDFEQGVTYLPEGLGFACGVHNGDRHLCLRDLASCNGPAVWIANHWFNAQGPWLCEGHVMARALRRWIELGRGIPADWRIIVMSEPHYGADVSKRQRDMGTGVMKVWREIAWQFADNVQVA